MRKILYLADKYNRRLSLISNDRFSILKELSKMDPTSNSRYLEWILKQYLNKQFDMEDLPRVKDTLTR